MLIIAGSITTEDGHRDAFCPPPPDGGRNPREAECQEYVFSPDPDNDNRILLFELWDDQESLELHFASEHMAEFQCTIADVAIAGRDIEKYTISDVRPVR